MQTAKQQATAKRGNFFFQGFEPVLFSCIVLAAVIYIISFRFLPLQDYPDWLFQGTLFTDALRGTLTDAYRLIRYPVPNSISTIVMGVLGLVMSPELAGKAFLVLYVILFASGSYFLLSANLPGKRRYTVLLYVPFLLILNVPFFSGNINYVFSLGLLFWGIGFCVNAQRQHTTPHPLIVAGISILLFFSHAISYAVFILFGALFCLGSSNKRTALSIGGSLLPSLSLFVLYTARRLSDLPAHDQMSFAGIPHLRSIIAYFSPFQYFYPFQDPLLAILGPVNLLFCVVAAALVAAGAISAFYNRGDKPLLFMIPILAVLVLFSPHRFLGIVEPGERFLYPFAWISLTFLGPVIHERPFMNRTLRWLFTAVFAFQIVFAFYYAGNVSRQLSTAFAQLRAYSGTEQCAIIRESDFDYEGSFTSPTPRPALLPRQSPLIRMPFYLAVEIGQYLPIFTTGMFAETRRPLSLHSVSEIRHTSEYPPRIIILGDGQGNRFITGLFDPPYASLAEEKYISFLARKN